MSSVLLVACFSLLPSSAFAGWIATASVGASIPTFEQSNITIDGDSGYSVGGSLGLRFGDMIQWDTAEITYLSANQEDASSLNKYTYSALAIGSGLRLGMFGSGSRFHPYVSFGIGGLRNNIDPVGIVALTEWGFEWNAGGGILFDLSDSLSVGVRYRYRSTSYDEADGVPIPEASFGIHNISLEIAFGG